MNGGNGASSIVSHMDLDVGSGRARGDSLPADFHLVSNMTVFPPDHSRTGLSLSRSTSCSSTMNAAAASADLLRNGEWERRLQAYMAAFGYPLRGPSNSADTTSLSGAADRSFVQLEHLLLPCPAEVSAMQNEIDRLHAHLHFILEQRDERISAGIAAAAKEFDHQLAVKQQQHAAELSSVTVEKDELLQELRSLRSRYDSPPDHSGKLRSLEGDNEMLKAKLAEAERGWLSLVAEKEKQWRRCELQLHEQIDALEEKRKLDASEIDELKRALERAKQSLREAERDVATRPEREVAELQRLRSRCAALTSQVNELQAANAALWKQLDVSNRELAVSKRDAARRKAEADGLIGAVQERAADSIRAHANHVEELEEEVRNLMARNSALVQELQKMRAEQ